MRDLLRVIRNKMNHFRELPPRVQDEVGAPPDGFYQYFASRFPGLLLHAYRFAYRNCAHEPQFRKYFYPEGSEQSNGMGGGGTGFGGMGGGGVEATVEALERTANAAAAAAAQKAAGRAAATAAAPPVEYPERHGAPDCTFYIKTGRCKFGATCKFHHPAGIHD